MPVYDGWSGNVSLRSGTGSETWLIRRNQLREGWGPGLMRRTDVKDLKKGMSLVCLRRTKETRPMEEQDNGKQ